MPAADVEVSASLVRRLVSAQQPDLAQLPVSLLANGWDNVTCRLGEELVVRLPRRQLAARLVEHEQRWLPVLAPLLPLPIPVPVRVGLPAFGYPWMWSIVPFLAGQVAADHPPHDTGEAAVTLGRFLGTLHAPAPHDAPVNPFRGVPLAARRATFAENAATVGGTIDQGAVRRIWADALAAPTWHRPPAWVHGDLHPANILIAEGRVSGVIDFGDITAGDPATDLAVAWMMLPAQHRPAFKAAYRTAGAIHAADDGLWRRARGWALNFALIYLAHSADNPQLAKVGADTLRAVLADEN